VQQRISSREHRSQFLRISSQIAHIHIQFVKLQELLADKSLVAFFKALILSGILKKSYVCASENCV